MNRKPGACEPCRGSLGGLLPWYVNGSLSPEDAQAFRQHLEDCASCRAEAGAHQALRVEISSKTDRLPDPLVSLEPLMTRIASSAGGDRWRLQQRRPQPPAVRVMAVVLAIQAVAILALAFSVAVVLGRFQPVAEYHTLGTPAAGHSRDEHLVRLVVEDSLQAAEFRILLEETGARLITGPDASGSYLLGIDIAAAGGRAEALRLVERLASRAGVIEAVLLEQAELK